MQHSVLTPAQWAKDNFAAVDLGDCRLERRAVSIATALARDPGGTLPRALPKWKDLKAAYRFLDNTAVSCDKLLVPHAQQVRNCCSGPGEYLLIEDTTTLSFTSRRSLNGIGRTGNDSGRGIFVHSTLAFRIDCWNQEQPQLSLLGLAGQQRWVREDELARGQAAAGRERKKRRFTRARESERWAKVLAELPASGQSNRRTYITDREGDIYEAFERAKAAGCDFVIRANQDRALLGRQDSLFEAAGKPTELGRYTLKLRTRDATAARVATLAVRATGVRLRPPFRPGGALPARPLFVVEAREVDAPSADQPICWVLLTSLECSTYLGARKVIELYGCRWLIEEYHKALKTGAGMEESQLEEARRIEALLGILSLVAVRLLAFKLQAHAHPTAAIGPEEIEPEALKILELHFGVPPGGWTHRSLWITIARFGGFLARKSDGTPGWQTLWRGWNRLRLMAEGARLLAKICG